MVTGGRGECTPGAGAAAPVSSGAGSLGPVPLPPWASADGVPAPGEVTSGSHCLKTGLGLCLVWFFSPHELSCTAQGWRLGAPQGARGRAEDKGPVGAVLCIRAFQNVVPGQQHLWADDEKFKFSGSCPDRRDQEQWVSSQFWSYPWPQRRHRCEVGSDAEGRRHPHLYNRRNLAGNPCSKWRSLVRRRPWPDLTLCAGDTRETLDGLCSYEERPLATGPGPLSLFHSETPAGLQSTTFQIRPLYPYCFRILYKSVILGGTRLSDS